MSAAVERMSTIIIGSSGMLILVICLLVIVLPDFAVFVTYIRNNCKDHTERII